MYCERCGAKHESGGRTSRSRAKRPIRVRRRPPPFLARPGRAGFGGIWIGLKWKHQSGKENIE